MNLEQLVRIDYKRLLQSGQRVERLEFVDASTPIEDNAGVLLIAVVIAMSAHSCSPRTACQGDKDN